MTLLQIDVNLAVNCCKFYSSLQQPQGDGAATKASKGGAMPKPRQFSCRGRTNFVKVDVDVFKNRRQRFEKLRENFLKIVVKKMGFRRAFFFRSETFCVLTTVAQGLL